MIAALPKAVSESTRPLREVRDWIVGPQGRIPRIALGIFACYLLWVLAAPATPVHALTSECYNVIVPLVAALAAWQTSRSATLDRRTQRAWMVYTLAFFALMVGDVIWFVYDYVIGARPVVSMADIMYVSFYPAMIWGFLCFRTARHSKSDLVKLWLDVGTVLITGGALIWYFVLDPQFDTGKSPLLDVILSGIYPVGDLVVGFTGLAILIRRPLGKSNGAIRMLMLSGFAMFGSDLVLGYSVVHTGTYQTGSWTDLGWQTAMLLWLLAACYQRWEATRPLKPLEDTEQMAEASLRVSFLPYVAAIVGYGLFVVALRPQWSAVDEIAVPVLILTALVLIRQVIAVRDNDRLANDRVAQEMRFRSLVQNSSDVITVIDEHGIIQFMSPAVERLFEWLPDELVGKHITETVHQDDAAPLAAFLGRLQSTEDATPTQQALIVRCSTRGGEWRTVETVATVLLDDPAIRGIVLNTRDVSERMALQAELAHQAYHDSLTQLANRSWFHTQVARAVQQAAYAPDHIAVIFLDLDNFKNINDSFGHADGDRLLIEVARRLLNATRGSDTVARLGGDEFAVLVGRVTNEADLIIIAERIANAMCEPITLAGGEVFSSASIGIARGTPGTTVDELLRNADLAMYVTKRQRRGMYTIFEPGMHAQAVARMEMETDLRHALTHEELTLLFQPIVSLANRQMLGVEALVRWRHSRPGLMLPGEFIPMAEESGLVLPLGRWVLMEACRQGARWRTMLPKEAPFTVAVNVSRRQLDQATFIDEVAAALNETGLPPHDLLLEVTESVIVRDARATLQRLNALKGLGIRLAIDDFGTGYSSLSFLQQFPVDVLKIDKSFIADAAHGESGPALIRAIIALGEALSLQTLAEGIEYQQQADALASMGCELAQGYYFSRPVRSTEVDALVQQTIVSSKDNGTSALLKPYILPSKAAAHS